MSHLLWRFYHNEDVESFRQLLSTGSHTKHQAKSYGGLGRNAHSIGTIVGSPSGYATSPRTLPKNRKASGQTGNQSGIKGSTNNIGRAEVNNRDHAGLTLLMRAVSSTSENAISFAMALLEHPAIDLYIQDTENGWTALHRALYFGNITLARAIIEKDSKDPTGQPGNAAQRAVNSVIKVKDFEGNSPFDVYNATIAGRTLQFGNLTIGSDDGSLDSAESTAEDQGPETSLGQFSIDGDEAFAWGSSRNHGLGFKDQDDRQHPEKINLKRPDHLLFRFYREHMEALQNTTESSTKQISQATLVAEIPTLISNRPIIIRDVVLSKLHSAILTTDPESNLYMCGFGPGGRLGTGDEVTRFSYVSIEDGGLAGKKVIKVALGLNHSLAVASDGTLLSWGTNTYGQLGYTLPRPVLKDEEPICATPRQIFGTLKRETIVGVAASAIHSVAYTSTSLFTWGKNEGQLGLMDSDSRSLEVQPVPRKVAASLFKAPISMVSAINGATIVLLTTYATCVFTNYGYNIIKLPLSEGLSNHRLKTMALSTRYDALPNPVSYITAGGSTIAAMTKQGDLFTMEVKPIDTNSTTSTTNPSKIKDSLTPPQRVWSLRKGHWDGMKSVGVTENGAVIICTQAGAVWQRIRRPNIKDAFSKTSLKRKDFKFQRIPGLTKVAAVRSTTFGVYAAIRKDCDVTRTQITIDDQSLWEDVASLLAIRDLKASETIEEEDTETIRSWTPSMPLDLFDPLKRAIFASPDLEADVRRHLLAQKLDESYDFELGTSASDVRIPVHGFILSRSPVLRDALSEFRRLATASVPEVLLIESDSYPESKSGHIKVKSLPRIVFQGLDFLSLINLIIYLYKDVVIDVWHFTRHAPRMAFGYRQIRVELMKTAAHLKLLKLESAVRLMSTPERRMDTDMRIAIEDARFFEDGDIILELEGADMRVHSAFMCRRCPFFEGLFNGRAGGQWLAGRRQTDSEPVRIDLKHIRPVAFKLVLRYIYADVGTEIFDDVVSADIDDFSELVMDVMAVSNELMLDRLSQICQQVIGRFVNTRNVCHLLNDIAPCSVTPFKETALEYLCLQLECMLENHLLNDLDDELLLELDDVVRSNQLTCLPFAKSNRAELLLHERHPSLAEDILEERQRRLRDMTFRARLEDDDIKISSSLRTRVGSLEDLTSLSPNHEKFRRKQKASQNAPFSPSIKPQDSTVDLMFDMDEDEALPVCSPQAFLSKPFTISTPNFGAKTSNSKTSWENLEPRLIPSGEIPQNPLDRFGLEIQNVGDGFSPSVKSWSTPALPSSKLNMREIMAQASSSRTSALSTNISLQKAKDDAEVKRKEAATKAALPKLSQKERKKQQQQALNQATIQPQISVDKGDGKSSSPWQVASIGPRTSLKDVLNEPGSLTLVPTKTLGSPIPPMTLATRRAASPDTRFAGQNRSNNGKNAKASSSSAGSSRPATQPLISKSSPIIPHSKIYSNSTAKAEPTLQLSMADIIGQQRREQEVIKEAVAKRSLQEIQDEQAFQEWWDQESRRTQEEEAARARSLAAASGRGGKSGSSRGKGGRGRGGRGRGDGSQRGRGRGREKAEKAPGAVL